MLFNVIKTARLSIAFARRKPYPVMDEVPLQYFVKTFVAPLQTTDPEPAVQVPMQFVMDLEGCEPQSVVQLVIFPELAALPPKRFFISSLLRRLASFKAMGLIFFIWLKD